jgi:DNA-binding NtrC family response regulator
MKPGTRVAIIEDERDLCFLLSSFLKGIGCEVVSFHSVQHFHADPGRQLSDWAIIDNNLPDGSGWELAGEWIAKRPDLKLILISANPDSPKIDQKKHVYYLFKPLGFANIQALLGAD